MCTDCNEPCYNCEEEVPVVQPVPLCWTIPPCDEGCEDTLNTDCITVANTTGIFVKGQSLTVALTNLSTYLSSLARVFNLTESPQLAIFGFSWECPSARIVVIRNGTTHLDATYTDRDALLAALQLLDATWFRNENYFYVAGTSTWTVTITC